MRPTIRIRAIPGMIALGLALAMSTASAVASGGGSGGGGGSTAPANPFVGNWEGIVAVADPFYHEFEYDFTFGKDLTFTLVVVDRRDGSRATRSGTYTLNAPSPGPYPYLTMVSNGQILLQEQYVLYAGTIILRWGIGPAITIAKL